MIIKIEKLLEEEGDKISKPHSESDKISYEDKLDQHVKEITDIRKPKSEMDNVDITFFRAIRKIKKGAYVNLYFYTFLHIFFYINLNYFRMQLSLN
jgi:hypothetical protein